MSNPTNLPIFFALFLMIPLISHFIVRSPCCRFVEIIVFDSPLFCYQVGERSVWFFGSNLRHFPPQILTRSFSRGHSFALGEPNTHNLEHSKVVGIKCMRGLPRSHIPFTTFAHFPYSPSPSQHVPPSPRSPPSLPRTLISCGTFSFLYPFASFSSPKCFRDPRDAPSETARRQASCQFDSENTFVLINKLLSCVFVVSIVIKSSLSSYTQLWRADKKVHVNWMYYSKNFAPANRLPSSSLLTAATRLSERCRRRDEVRQWER